MPQDNAIKSARLKAGKTRAEIAAEVGVCERSVRRWEDGETLPPSPVLIRLARVLRRNPEDLVAA